VCTEGFRVARAARNSSINSVIDNCCIRHIMQQFPPFTHVHPMIISSRHASHVSPLQSVSVANRSAGHPTARRQDPPAPATAALPPSRGARPPTFVPRSTGSTLIPAAPHTSSPGPACARSGADPVLLQARLGDPGIAGEEKGTTREIRETRRPDRGGVRAAHTARRPTRQRSGSAGARITPRQAAARTTAVCGPSTRRDARHRSPTRQRSGCADVRIAPAGSARADRDQYQVFGLGKPAALITLARAWRE
jgi:hypothetical protein